MLNCYSKLFFGFSHKSKLITPVTRISRKIKLLESHRKAVLKDTRAEARGVFRTDITQPRYDHKTNFNAE